MVIAIGAGIAAAGTIGGSMISSSATEDAANAQAQSASAALAQNQSQFNTTQANQAPWLTAGGGALGKLSSMYGISSGSTGTGTAANSNGTATSPSQAAYAANSNGGNVDPNANFYLSPDYQFALNQGEKGITAAGAAGNGTANGATQKAEIGYAGNLASGQYQNYKNGLLSLAGLGQTTSGQAATAGQNAANANSSILTNEGNNLASSYLGQGQIASNATTGLGSIAQQYMTSNNNNLTPIENTGINSSVGLTAQPIASQYAPVSVPGF